MAGMQELPEGFRSELGTLNVLQWIYGNIVNVHAEDHADRRRELMGPHTCSNAQVQQLGHLAAAWRRLYDLNMKKHELNFLRWAAGWSAEMQCMHTQGSGF